MEQNKNMGKRILLSAYACSPYKGSESGNGWSWATQLAALGYEVWCFTNTQDQRDIEKAMAEQNIPNLNFVFVALPGIPDKKWLNHDSKAIYFHYLMWRSKAASIAKAMHKKQPFYLGHHVTFGSIQQGTFIWKIQGMKKIFGPVGGGQKAPVIMKEYFGNAWKIERLRSFISNWTIKNNKNFLNSVLNTDYVLVTNDDTKKMALAVKGVDPQKIHFVPDTAIPKIMEGMEYVERAPGKKLKLLWVGRMLPRKGLNLVLEAMSKVSPDVDYSLTIVGGGEQFELLDGWIKQYGVDKSKLIITGKIPFQDVVEHYKQSDVFIFCSLRDSFAAQLTEALAFGLPTIVLNIHGAVFGVPDDCGIKINPVTKEGTLKDIAAAVEKLYHDTELRKQMSKNAFEYSKNNTWVNRVKYVTEKFY